jgi:hypothetical protein
MGFLETRTTWRIMGEFAEVIRFPSKTVAHGSL